MSRYIDADAIKDKAWKAESEACFYAKERELPKVPSDTPQAGFERKEQEHE